MRLTNSGCLIVPASLRLEAVSLRPSPAFYLIQLPHRAKITFLSMKYVNSTLMVPQSASLGSSSVLVTFLNSDHYTSVMIRDLLNILMLQFSFFPTFFYVF